LPGEGLGHPDGAHLIRGEISVLEGGGGFREQAATATQDFEAVSVNPGETAVGGVSHWVTFAAPDNAHIWEASNSPMSIAPAKATLRAGCANTCLVTDNTKRSL
jgi:hypothetical protein